VTLHPDEIPLALPLVRALVDRDRPDLAGAALTPLRASGSDNAQFRLGTELLVRVPRQPGGSRMIEKEARWQPHVAPALRVAVPEIVHVGAPGFGYPERWSETRWIDGRVPDVPPRADTTELARDLAGVARALGEAAVPDDALADPALRGYRGEPLARLDRTTRGYLAECRALPDLDLDLDACERVWAATMALPESPAGPPRWLHGDLLAENLLVRARRLAAVLDFGGLAVGDPTVDLAAAWEVLDPAGREVFRTELTVDELTWLRARGWALALSVMTFPYYWRTMPGRCAARLASARAVLADAAR
jgi:aminoglycoside phosphotransferase (APT) family kinase protein